MAKVNKESIANLNWREIYEQLDNNTHLVGAFVRHASRQKDVPINDLDNMLVGINKHIKKYVEVNGSGQVTFF